MIKKLIVNADDFGMTQGNSLGILLAHQKGIVTSTTCMMNMPYARWALNKAKNYPSLGVGIHLVLTVGRPLVEGATSYTDENGNFKRPKDYHDGKPHANLEELYKEWKAQIDKYITITGHKPTHLDSHHDIHLLPWHFQVTKKLAEEYDLPIRQKEQVLYTYEYARCEDRMYGEDKINYEFMTQALNSDDEILEYVCHPALMDQRLYDMTSYSLPRMKELELVLLQDIHQFIIDNDIQLINYSHIKKVSTI